MFIYWCISQRYMASRFKLFLSEKKICWLFNTYLINSAPTVFFFWKKLCPLVFFFSNNIYVKIDITHKIHPKKKFEKRVAITDRPVLSRKSSNFVQIFGPFWVRLYCTWRDVIGGVYKHRLWWLELRTTG